MRSAAHRAGRRRVERIVRGEYALIEHAEDKIDPTERSCDEIGFTRSDDWEACALPLERPGERGRHTDFGLGCLDRLNGLASATLGPD